MQNNLPIKLIVGLGNPGNEYTKTRHNAGFWLLDELASSKHATFKLESKFYAELAKFKHQNQEIILVKPQTFMNLSGKAVGLIASFYKIAPSQVLVIHDELDFMPGIVKLKQGGGNGGHNGLKDIDRVMGRDYWRMRIGIGHPGEANLVSSYVLKKPPVAENELIHAAIEKALSCMGDFLDGDIEFATKTLHTRIS